MPTGQPEELRGSRIAATCGALGIGLLLGGCAGMMQQLEQELSGEKVEFEPVYQVQLDSRGGAATAASQSPAELARNDCMHLGDLAVTRSSSRRCASATRSSTPSTRATWRRSRRSRPRGCGRTSTICAGAIRC